MQALVCARDGGLRYVGEIACEIRCWAEVWSTRAVRPGGGDVRARGRGLTQDASSEAWSHTRSHKEQRRESM